MLECSNDRTRDLNTFLNSKADTIISIETINLLSNTASLFSPLHLHNKIIPTLRKGRNDFKKRRHSLRSSSKFTLSLSAMVVSMGLRLELAPDSEGQKRERQLSVRYI